MTEVKIKPYLADQIKAEEEYHDWLKIMLSNVLLMLLGSVKSGNYSYATLRGVLDDYRAQNYHRINVKSGEVAKKIVHIANKSFVHTGNNVSRAALNAMSISRLQGQINGGVDLLLNQVLTRVVSLIPFGFAGLYSQLFTDETNEKDLYQRTNNSSMRFAREVYTEGVFNSLINIGSLYGYTEYAADNRHDSRVRPLHAKYFVPSNWIPFNSPPPCGHVSTEYGCRCYIVAMR